MLVWRRSPISGRSHVMDIDEDVPEDELPEDQQQFLRTGIPPREFEEHFK